MRKLSKQTNSSLPAVKVVQTNGQAGLTPDVKMEVPKFKAGGCNAIESGIISVEHDYYEVLI